MVDIFKLQYPQNELYKLPASLLAKCQHYHLLNPLFSYCCGLYCAQVTLILSDKLKDVESILTDLLQYLEDTKPKINKFIDGQSANFHLRKEFGGQLNHRFNHLVSIIQTSDNEELINFGQMVELLLDLGFLYDVLRGLFPLKEFSSKDEQSMLMEEISDDEVEYRIHYCKSQASTILSIVKLGQNPLDYMSQLQMVPTDNKEIEGEEQDISKEQVDDMIQKVLKLTDDNLPDIEDDQSSVEQTEDEIDKDIVSTREDDSGREDDSNFDGDGGEDGGESLPLRSDPFNLPLAPVGFNHDGNKQFAQEGPTKIESEAKHEGGKERPCGIEKPTIANTTATTPVQRFVRHPPKDYTKQELQEILDKDTLLLLAIKDAKFAISALHYEDCETAVSKLQSAIDLIQKFKQ